MNWKLLQARASRAIIQLYILMKFYMCFLVVKLHCGENHSRIATTELDLWLLIAGTKQPWRKISPIFEADDSHYSHYSSLTVPKDC